MSIIICLHIYYRDFKLLFFFVSESFTTTCHFLRPLPQQMKEEIDIIHRGGLANCVPSEKVIYKNIL